MRIYGNGNFARWNGTTMLDSYMVVNVCWTRAKHSLLSHVLRHAVFFLTVERVIKQSLHIHPLQVHIKFTATYYLLMTLACYKTGS